MIQGHFGAALLISAFTAQITPLPYLFLAAQVQDLLIALFAYSLGIEKTRFALNSENKVYPVELVHVPYSHSLFVTLVLSLCCCLFPIVPASKVALSCAILSHWLLDFIVHIPDLDPCFPFVDCGKVGLGLWRYLVPSLVLECAIVVAGSLFYVRSVRDHEIAKGVMWKLLPLATFMVLITVALPFIPPHQKMDSSITVQTYLLYSVIALVGWAIERPVRQARMVVKRE